MPKHKKSEGSKARTIGATYRAASTSAIVASPALQAAFSRGKGQPITPDYLKMIATKYRTDAVPFAEGLAVHAADQFVGQKVFNHSGALGRGSVTAWASELAPVFEGLINAKTSGALAGTDKYVQAKTGYNPASGFGFSPATWTYLGVKYVGGAVRKLSNVGMVRQIAAPVKRGLSAMGATL